MVTTFIVFALAVMTAATGATAGVMSAAEEQLVQPGVCMRDGAKLAGTKPLLVGKGSPMPKKSETRGQRLPSPPPRHGGGRRAVDRRSIGWRGWSSHSGVADSSGRTDPALPGLQHRHSSGGAPVEVYTLHEGGQGTSILCDCAHHRCAVDRIAQGPDTRPSYVGRGGCAVCPLSTSLGNDATEEAIERAETTHS